MILFQLAFQLPVLLFSYPKRIMSHQLLDVIGILIGIVVIWACCQLYFTNNSIVNVTKESTSYQCNIIGYYHTRTSMNSTASLLIITLYACVIQLFLHAYKQGDFTSQGVKVFLGLGILVFVLGILVSVQLRKELIVVQSLIAEN